MRLKSEIEHYSSEDILILVTSFASQISKDDSIPEYRFGFWPTSLLILLGSSKL